MGKFILLGIILLAVFLAGCTTPLSDSTTPTTAPPNITPEKAASDIPNFISTNASTELSAANISNITVVKLPKPALNLSTLFLEQNIRWRKFPVKIYIATETCTDTQVYEIKRALEIWERETVASFSLTDNKNASQVVTVKCYPETQSYYLGDDEGVYQKLGEALPAYVNISDFNIIEGGHVNIYRTTIACDRPQRYIHEFGHILGLNHTQDDTDIMYPYEGCSQLIKPDTIGILEKLYSSEVNEYVERLFKTETPTCPVNTTSCGGRCWPQCSENYTLSCDDIEPSCNVNWTKVNTFDWTKFDDYKIECNGELYPPCQGDQMFVCEYEIAYCMGREDFKKAAWWTRCPDTDNLYCDEGCRSPCLGTAYCSVDKYYCTPKANTTNQSNAGNKT